MTLLHVNNVPNRAEHNLKDGSHWRKNQSLGNGNILARPRQPHDVFLVSITLGCSIIKETANSVILSCAILRLSIRSILSGTVNLNRLSQPCYHQSCSRKHFANTPSSLYPQQQSQTMSIYFNVRRSTFKTGIWCVYHISIIITDALYICTSSSIHYEEPGPAFNIRRKVGLARRRQSIYFLPGGSSQRR